VIKLGHIRSLYVKRREARGKHCATAAGKCQPEGPEELGTKSPRHIHESTPICQPVRLPLQLSDWPRGLLADIGCGVKRDGKIRRRLAERQSRTDNTNSRETSIRRSTNPSANV
jgi:hypothetical protein